jgi:hypothetical protein
MRAREGGSGRGGGRATGRRMEEMAMGPSRAWSTRSKGGSEWVGRSGPRSGKGGGWAEYPPGISVRVSDDPSACWPANLLQTRLASLILLYLVYFIKEIVSDSRPSRLFTHSNSAAPSAFFRVLLASKLRYG